MLSNNIFDQNFDLCVGASPENINVMPRLPYSDISIEFLNELSKSIMADSAARRYPDVISFAFWCRKANLRKKAVLTDTNIYMIGRGLAFHITPSNVPVNFAFSFAFGVLSGNSNIVRVPKQDFEQKKIILKHIEYLFSDPKFLLLSQQNSFILFDRNEALCKQLSSISNCRLIWGGDETVNYFKTLQTSARNVDICFADRYSLSIIDASKVLDSPQSKLSRLCLDFCNDNLLFNQLACSSSHLIIWRGSTNVINSAKKRFWTELEKSIKADLKMSDTEFVERFTRVSNIALRFGNIKLLNNLSDNVLRSEFTNIEEELVNYKVGYGYFSEVDNVTNIMLAKLVTDKFQTITYYGIDKTKLVADLLSEGAKGIDRIVPIGQALNLDVIWDGYDLISKLTRTITVQ